MYKTYLNLFENKVDGITEFVAYQTKKSLLFFGNNCQVLKTEDNLTLKVIYKQTYIARIIEGCNAISVIILFASFVFAFSSTFKKTLLYIIFGSVLIFVLNIFRINLLIICLYHFPKQESFLHNIVFPTAIYGVVFALWLVWVLNFFQYKKPQIT